MLQTTHVYLFNDKWQILLWMKKRWFGAGKWNGFGGKNLEGETIIQTALRELQEEANIIRMPEQVEKAGILHFFRDAHPERNQDVHIFRGIYDGDFSETEEMRPQRFDTDKLPFEDMREDDAIWMPKLIAGEYLDMDFRFDKDGNLVK